MSAHSGSIQKEDNNAAAEHCSLLLLSSEDPEVGTSLDAGVTAPQSSWASKRRWRLAAVAVCGVATLGTAAFLGVGSAQQSGGAVSSHSRSFISESGHSSTDSGGDAEEE